MILCQSFYHDHPWPPILVSLRTNHAVCCLMRKCPLDKFLYLRFEHSIVELVSERNQSIEKVGAALPAFACTAKPTTVWSQIRPELVEMAPEAIGLDAQLPLKPTGRLYFADMERDESCCRKVQSTRLFCRSPGIDGAPGESHCSGTRSEFHHVPPCWRSHLFPRPSISKLIDGRNPGAA